jgi:hypothetical protein
VPRQGAIYTNPDVIKFFKENLGDARHAASLIPEPGTTGRERFEKGIERLTWGVEQRVT